jgi:cytochrome oxidase Cu insertion factor (SCO1/SenC/PrrC family)
MNKLSAVARKPVPPMSLSFYRALFLAVPLGVLACVCPPVGAYEQPATTRLQSNNGPRKARVTYSCPMHAEVKSLKRGKCPKCKMDLRPVKTETGSVTIVHANSDSSGDNRTVDDMTTTAASARAPDARRMVIPDVEVLDQDGLRIHFYSDLIKGKTIVINFIFTNCTTICPPMAATFARIQKQMGDRVGRDVHFISISVDPLTDTPERLKTWGAKFKAGDGWTFVTGDKEEINKLLKSLGGSVARREDHSPTILVGNDLKGVWTRTYGLANPSQIVGLILNVMEGKVDEFLTKEASKQ